MTTKINPENEWKAVYGEHHLNRLNLDDFFVAMKASTPCAPATVDIEIPESVVFPEWSDDEVTIKLVPTLIKPVHTDAGFYDFEFEGWVLGDFPERIWLQGFILNGQTDSDAEGSIRRLPAGEQVGTDRLFPEHVSPHDESSISSSGSPS